jgi:hypothetical protein
MTFPVVGQMQFKAAISCTKRSHFRASFEPGGKNFSQILRAAGVSERTQERFSRAAGWGKFSYETMPQNFGEGEGYGC